MEHSFVTLVINKTNIDELISMFKNGLYEKNHSPIEELIAVKNGSSDDDLVLFSSYGGAFQYVSSTKRFHYENGYYDIPDVETLAAFLMLPTKKSREVFLKDYSSNYPFKALKERS